MIESRFIEKLLKNREIEFKSLGDVTEMKRGKTITAKDASGGDIPVISGGQKPAYYHNEYNRNGKTITVAGSGAYAGFIMYWEEPIFVSDAFSIKSDETLLDLKYVYHFLLQHQQKIYGMKKGSGVPHVYPKDLSTLVIPIPPLDVQQEIVRILDAFTSLTAELTAELTSRQKQYQYFRDKLLNFDDISDRGGYETNPITKALWHNKKVVFKALGNISENLDFMRKPITSGLREKGNIPYYGASGIVDYVKDYIFEGDYLLVSEDGANLLARNTPIAFSISGKNWVNNHAHVLKFNTYTERRFVEFYLNNIDLTPYISGASQPKLNKNNLSNIKIPVPPFEEQQRIVTILDKFETLTNSIVDGLPKEIELRQKQYEYYREKLLSFPQ
ncbi:restriction endonuclease subunit S [Glaesserella parasuis]|uniref:restriction endonuclease subunit S n=1 Tax=Glaesserella parasuis TaxID=738 RepID=UPI00192506DE|nr:restriction endonuclease subunit S [Glaesserella parasuis]MDP0042807.1 restriction endonuclease subunit S [Glaesserella parasuis]MDP0134304.1 restriction endonuclease subunit S [Glaesserella parasuis]MDP0142788.1 restriction endonuclease subunit S [Glaesserella parasuis]MDP0155601.1 restriction endonuclease subunit S [Glaesserella parasuis]MDP0237931.1 restriction endonuclease subunit S [Glaesserella parasuis]